MTDQSAPQFFVAVRHPTSGAEERVDQSERVLSMSFEDTEAKADKLVLSIDNYDLSQLDSPLWQPGNIVEFSFGYPGAMSPTREMKIQTVKGFNPLQVEAHGDEAIFNRRPRTDRKWENVKRSDVVRKIAEEYGYQPDQLHITDTKLVVDQVTQGRMTDLQLIKSLAFRDGFEFYIDFDGLHFHPRNLDQRPLKEVTYFTDRTGDIISVSVEDSRAPGKPGAVAVAGRDPMNKETFKVDADDKSTPRTTVAPERTSYGVIEKIDGVTGATHEESVPVKTVAQEITIPSREVTKEAATQGAQGLFKQLQLKAVSMTLGLRGDAQLMAKSIIAVKGLGARLSGNCYVISVKHDLGAGFTSTAKVRRDGHSTAVGQGGFRSTTAASTAKANNKDPLQNVDAAGKETLSGAFRQVEVIDPVTGATSVKLVYSGGRNAKP